ncbi:MAG: TlpA disulfide reductase family protein [Acidimicrobiales bacterium]
MTWVLVLIVVAAVVVFTGSGDNGSPDAASPEIAEETAPVEVAGTPLPPLAETDTAIGTPIPSVTASLMDGGTTTIGPDGTVRLIAFFAHWCPHCRAEVPVARDWLADTEIPGGVEVLAVSTAVEPSADNYPPSRWLDDEDWPTPVLLDDPDGAIARAFGLSSFPFWVAVDADGNVAARTSGGLTADQLDAFLATAVAGATPAT